MRKKLNYSVKDQESGAAMILAIILLLLMISITTYVATSSLNQSNVNRSTNVRSALLSAANDGLDWGLSYINSTPAGATIQNIDNYTKASPFTSPRRTVENVENVTYKVWSEKIVTNNNLLSYYIYAKAYSTSLGENKDPVTLRMVVEALSYDSASWNGDLLAFVVSSRSAYASGILSTDSMTVASGGKVYAYNSESQGNTPSGTASSTVRTNGSVTVGNTSSGISRILASAVGAGAGCLPASVCNTVGAPTVGYSDTVLTIDTSTERAAVCPSVTSNWVSSAQSNTLTANTAGNVLCVSSLTFDTNTIVSGAYSADNPLKVYVAGNVTVNPGVTVNWGKSPQALQIAALTGDLLIKKGTSGSQAKASFYYAGKQACTIGDGTGTINPVFFGALACTTINVTANSTVYLDTAAYSISNANLGKVRVWIRGFQEEV